MTEPSASTAQSDNITSRSQWCTIIHSGPKSHNNLLLSASLLRGFGQAPSESCLGLSPSACPTVIFTFVLATRHSKDQLSDTVYSGPRMSTAVGDEAPGTSLGPLFSEMMFALEQAFAEAEIPLNRLNSSNDALSPHSSLDRACFLLGSKICQSYQAVDLTGDSKSSRKKAPQLHIYRPDHIASMVQSSHFSLLKGYGSAKAGKEPLGSLSSSAIAEDSSQAAQNLRIAIMLPEGEVKVVHDPSQTSVFGAASEGPSIMSAQDSVSPLTSVGHSDTTIPTQQYERWCPRIEQGYGWEATLKLSDALKSRDNSDRQSVSSAAIRLDPEAGTLTMQSAHTQVTSHLTAADHSRPLIARHQSTSTGARPLTPASHPNNITDWVVHRSHLRRDPPPSMPSAKRRCVSTEPEEAESSRDADAHQARGMTLESPQTRCRSEGSASPSRQRSDNACETASPDWGGGSSPLVGCSYFEDALGVEGLPGPYDSEDGYRNL